jgi:PKD repeat protein
MERNDNDLFDQLVREKLTGYAEPPEPEWIKNIHAKKSRVINLYHLYRLMLITALVGAGIFASVQFVPYASNMEVSKQRNQNTLTSQGATLQPANSSAKNNSVANTSNGGLLEQSTLIEAPIAQPEVLNATPKTRGNNFSKKRTPITQKKAAPTRNAASVTPESMLIEVPTETPILDEKPSSTDDAQTEKTPTESSNNCTASFEYYTSYTGEINFTNTSSINKKSIVAWQFGDGISSAETEPKHTYRSTGKYEVTLLVKDNQTGCEATQTKLISYKNPNDKYTPITLSGELHAGTTPVKNGQIELYQFNPQKGGFVLNNVIRTSQSGAYDVVIQRNERYILKGIPSSELPDYTSSYWGNSDDIENATEIVIMPSEKDNLLGYNIELALAEKQKTSDDFKDESITSATDQNVLLLDLNNNIVGVGKVDVNGDYVFTGSVPPGDYKVVNPANGASTAKTVVGGEPVSGSIFDKNTGSVSAKNDEKVSVFPNPAGNTVNFGINSSAEETATIILTDAAGVELSRKQMVFTSGFNQTQYDLSNYSPGIYYVLVFKGNQQVLSNRLVKMIDTGK